jgi:hypothetical protein
MLMTFQTEIWDRLSEPKTLAEQLGLAGGLTVELYLLEPLQVFSNTNSIFRTEEHSLLLYIVEGKKYSA